MKKTISATLLSGLVFPGTGQIALKQIKRGVFFIIATIFSLLWFVTLCTQKALAIINELEAKGAADLPAIQKAASEAVHAADTFALKAALACMGLCWLVATVDAYRLGRQMDKDLSAEKPFELN